MKDSWEKMGVRVCILENKPAFFEDSFRVPAFTQNRDILVDLLNSIIFAVITLVYGIFLSNGFCVVLCPNNDFGSMLSALLVSKLRRKRSIVYVHHLEGVTVGKNPTVMFSDLYAYAKGIYGPAKGLLKALAIKVCAILVPKFSASICVSPVYARMFPNSYASTNGVDERFLRLISDSSLHVSESHAVCYVGRLSPDKGIPDLLKIWREVMTKSSEAKLVLAGPDEIDVNRYITSYGLESSVEYKGIVNEQEKSRIMIESRTLVTASKNEAFSLAISEALLCGTPAICYNTVTLLHQWGDCPYVYMASNSSDFVNRIIDLLDGGQHVDREEVKGWAIKRLRAYGEIAQKEFQVVMGG